MRWGEIMGPLYTIRTWRYLEIIATAKLRKVSEALPEEKLPQQTDSLLS